MASMLNANAALQFSEILAYTTTHAAKQPVKLLILPTLAVLVNFRAPNRFLHQH